ncbi:aminoglycoside phosphotransferase family protein [Kribbella sp. VKM Ac-2568]|uniref:aminoglycoside phosphotransferase family protein n=1 Tax=Kribbella sp. VKM Ac-2568 TaxID=2512219 RepID=UPI001051FC1C|nr:aminoglycoside phosphotransferase family protein [Kribbella sp. VKM Ac-2568]TCM47107.1 aminoglycoside phosphotransferase (APT) family kinase protein [Kribbella sp. VKM Ac-2568]
MTGLPAGDLPAITSEPTAEVIAAIADRYGVRAEAVREVPDGVANHAFALGDDPFLRIPRREEFERDLQKEVAVIPVARAAGVRTPAMVDFDATRTLVDAPYMVIEQVHGTDLIEADPPNDQFWQDLGSQVALLHRIPHTPLDGVPTDDGGGDPRPTVDHLATLGYLDPGTADWLLGWFDRLATRFPQGLQDPQAQQEPQAQPRVLLHGDLAPQNLLTRHHKLEALIDWGDAAWGPPGMEFAKLRLEQVAATLPAYTGQSPSKSDGQLEAAALWFHLSWGLSGIPKPPRPNERHWTAPPASRLLGVLRFFAAGPPEPWPGLR